MRSFNSKANTWHPHEHIAIEKVPTRQRTRAALRRAAYDYVGQRLAHLARSARKVIARDMAIERWQSHGHDTKKGMQA